MEYCEIRFPEPDASPRGRSKWLWISVALISAFALVTWWYVIPLVGGESEPSATSPRTVGCGMAGLGVLGFVFITCVSALIVLLVRGCIAAVSTCDRERE
jgi:hypothetical protein